MTKHIAPCRSARAIQIVLSLLILQLCGCLRFTPARSALETKSEREADEQAFYRLDQLQRDRLNQLLASRTSSEAAQQTSTYRIGAGDVLQFSVFDVPEFDKTSARVQPTGHISLPLIGTVTAAGLSEQELQSDVTKRLAQFIRSPQVSMFISEYEANKVSVIGAVAKPGRYPIKRNDYSLIDIISEAGGKTDKAGGTIVLIPPEHRPEDSASDDAAPLADTTAMAQASAHGVEIYFDDLVGRAARPPISVPLRPGDTVVVPDAGQVQVDGEVKTPGSYPLSARMTLLGAIASAGGLTYSADITEIEVIREIEAGRKAAVTVNLEQLAVAEGKDVRLRDADVVRVPSHRGRFAARQFIEGINKLVGFGVSATP